MWPELRLARPSGALSRGLVLTSLGLALGLVGLAAESASAASSDLLWRATIPVGDSPLGVAVDPTTNTVYVANSVTGTVSVISALSNKVTTAITTGAGAYSIAVNPLSGTVYVANYVSCLLY